MSQPIRVLHLRSASDAGGGPDKTIFKTGAVIDRSRVDYRVAYLHKPDADMRSIHARAEEAGVGLACFPGRAPFDIAQLRAVSRYVTREKIDILHTHDPKTDLCALMLRRMTGVRVIGTAHGWIVRRLRSRLYYALDIWALRRHDAVIAVSKRTAQIAREAGGADPVVIHNAIDLNEWSRRDAPPCPVDLPSEAFVVGFVGRLSAEKGIEEYVRTVFRCLPNIPSLLCVIAGDGPDADAARALAESLGVAERIRFLGRLDPTQVRGLYARMDVLLSPSRTEGLPNNLLEACAMEVPVVATRVGGVGEMLEDGSTALLAESGDVPTLAAHIEALAADPGRRRRLAQAARAVIAESFSFRLRTRRLTEFYEAQAGKNR